MICPQRGLQVILNEAYAATSPDLSNLVTKLRRARPDVIFHIGYFPDITLFLRQAREQGLRWKALIGHAAGYSQYDKLHAALGDDVDDILNIDTAPAQLLDPAVLAPGMGDLVAEAVRRWQAKKGEGQIPPNMFTGFGNTYLFLSEVVARAIREQGGYGPEQLRQAALSLDLPDGSDMEGYGVKFAGPDDPMAGQNLRSFAFVMQYTGGQTRIVYPPKFKTADPVLPLPPGHTYAVR